ncbi:MAG: IS66 family transposase [Deltaproteobacteria bacterium]|nr:IS66 family transposase [Deltaproteobacteria bacterium]
MTLEEARAVYAAGEEKTVACLLAQAQEIERLKREQGVLLSALGDTNRRFCADCFEKQQKIDRLEGEVVNLRQKLRYREKTAQEGYFGSSTPSSKKPVKANSGAGKEKKKSGAKAGHRGRGRRRFRREEADQVVPLPVTKEHCECGGPLESRGAKDRSVLDLPPIEPLKFLYLLGRKQCTSCGKMHYSQAPGVLPGWFYGNGLISQAAVMHYVHGIPMGTIERMLGLPRCSLIDTFHELAKLFAPVLPKLMAEYRVAPVKHADETPWRTQGQSGYAWVFHCDTVTLFLFRHTRSGEVPVEVFGNKCLPGVLVRDRYSGYSRVPCKVQFCYEHLKRNLEDLVKKYPDSQELKHFAEHVLPLFREAMQLRGKPIPDNEFYEEALKLKTRIVAAMEADAQDEAIRTYQEIFRTNPDKLYHWADDRRVPAHNNKAECELRPTVIARKVSFGSQSSRGRHTREVLASVLNTLAQRGRDPAEILNTALDRLAVVPDLDRFELLFGGAAPSDKRDSLPTESPKRLRPVVQPPSSQQSQARAVPPRRQTFVPNAVAAAVVALFLLAANALLLATPHVADIQTPVAAATLGSARHQTDIASFQSPTRHETRQDTALPHFPPVPTSAVAEHESVRGPPAYSTRQ